jgi:hypothetical protein
MNWRRSPLLLLVVLLLSDCATIPTGPSVMVMPGQGKSFEAFQADDSACRQWARQQIGVAPSDAANQNLAAGAALGTLAGAGLGAAIGAASGHPGEGAAIGAASGLLGGTAMASGPAYAAGEQAQRQYDIAYQQCMAAKGNQIPGRVRYQRRGYMAPPPPPPGYRMPPPPPGYAPGPPDAYGYPPDAYPLPPPQ